LQNKSVEPDSATKKTKIAYVTNYYPLLSETFIIAEVKNLNQHGFDVRVFSLFKPKPNENDLNDGELTAQTIYGTPFMRFSKLLPAHLFFLWKMPLTYMKTFRYAFHHRNREASLLPFLRMSINGVEQRQQAAYVDRQNILLHFFVVMPFAVMIHREGYTWMHAAFANIPSSFTLLTEKLTGVPYSISAHAMDIFITPELLPEKFANARFIATCNHYNKGYLQERYPETDLNKVHPIYHGTDLTHFTSRERTIKEEPPVLLTVGRLVKKKGLAGLLRASLTLKEKNVPFQIWIVGDGPERPRLELFCRMNQLHEVVKFWGACPPDHVIDFYQKSTLFVLPCVEDESGDRDGIPNVIAEAMAMRLPIVSSFLSGIPELVTDRVSGRLLAPNDIDGLAAVLQELLENPTLAKRMGAMGRKTVEGIFDAKETVKELVALFAQHLGDGVGLDQI
jgi:glycosyltransferase involved in cell wall biosynthesis